MRLKGCLQKIPVPGGDCKLKVTMDFKQERGDGGWVETTVTVEVSV